MYPVAGESREFGDDGDYQGISGQIVSSWTSEEAYKNYLVSEICGAVLSGSGTY